MSTEAAPVNWAALVSLVISTISVCINLLAFYLLRMERRRAKDDARAIRGIISDMNAIKEIEDLGGIIALRAEREKTRHVHD